MFLTAAVSKASGDMVDSENYASALHCLYLPVAKCSQFARGEVQQKYADDSSVGNEWKSFTTTPSIDSELKYCPNAGTSTVCRWPTEKTGVNK